LLLSCIESWWVEVELELTTRLGRSRRAAAVIGV
jgi:hypothetical protein